MWCELRTGLVLGSELGVWESFKRLDGGPRLVEPVLAVVSSPAVDGD